MMPLSDLLFVMAISAVVFGLARYSVFQVRLFMDEVERDPDQTQALRLATLGCLAGLALVPILLSSFLLFVLSVAALAMGDWS